MSSSDNPPIQVTKQASPDVLQRLGVKSWPTWGCGVSEFPWSYSDTETSYIIKGKVIVTPSPSNGKDGVLIEAGDVAVFPEGLSCTWKVLEPIQKHYNFS